MIEMQHVAKTILARDTGIIKYYVMIRTLYYTYIGV